MIIILRDGKTFFWIGNIGANANEPRYAQLIGTREDAMQVIFQILVIEMTMGINQHFKSF